MISGAKAINSKFGHEAKINVVYITLETLSILLFFNRLRIHGVSVNNKEVLAIVIMWETDDAKLYTPASHGPIIALIIILSELDSIVFDK